MASVTSVERIKLLKAEWRGLPVGGLQPGVLWNLRAGGLRRKEAKTSSSMNRPLRGSSDDEARSKSVFAAPSIFFGISRHALGLNDTANS